MRKLFVHRKPDSFGVDLRSSSFFPLTASLLFVGLLISLFVLPTGYTYDEICPRCGGEGTIICRDCSGSGICRWCGGDGEMFEDWWCAPCHGSGRCSTCEGNGWYTCVECEGTGLLVHWMYNLIGATVAPSFISVLLFLGLFIFSGWMSALYLSFNEWIYQVDDMGFWFNPSFMTWLFAKHRKRWAKWTTGTGSILAIYLGALIFWILSLKQIILETFLVGTLLSIPVVILFSIFFYKSYTSKLEGS
jgi:hypothetical protein